jgi:hypothetical protein
MIRPIRLFCLFLFLAVCSCGKKETPTPAAPADAAASTSSSAAPPVITPAERAAKLGFIAHLPADTEAVLSFPNAQTSLTLLKNSGLWKFFEARSRGASSGDETPDEPADDSMKDIDGSFGNDRVNDGSFDQPANSKTGSEKIELTIAFGKTTAAQTGALLEINRKLTALQMSQLVRGLADADTTEALATRLNDSDFMAERFRDLLADDAALATVESLRMPPLLIALRNDQTGSVEMATGIASMISMIGMIGDVVEPLSIERAGSTFEGYRIPGSSVVTMLQAQRDALNTSIGEEAADRLIAAAASRELIVLSGTFQDHVLIFIGGSADDFVLVTDPALSLAANDRLGFTDGYRDRELLAVFHGSQELLDTVSRKAGGTEIADALCEAFTSLDEDTKTLQESLRMLSSSQAKLIGRTTNEAIGIAAFHDNGWQIEIHGGGDQGMIDWDASNRLSALGNPKETAFFANFSIVPDAQTDTNRHLAALGNSACLIAKWIAARPIEDVDFIRFRDGFRVFDEVFREDLGEAWTSLSDDLDASLGNERAYVIDFKGTPPIMPDVPTEILRDLPFPRTSMIAPVKDRANLSQAWSRLDVVMQRMIGKIGELIGQSVPKLQPIDTERNGFTTWFLPFPVFTDGFMPSVSLNDSWFAASTSRGQAIDLLSSASDPLSSESRGLRVSVGVNALRDGMKTLCEVMRVHPETFEADPAQIDSFVAFLDAIDELERVDLYARRDAGQLRTSIHIRTR